MSAGITMSRVVRAVQNAGRPITGAQIYDTGAFTSKQEVYNGLAQLMKLNDRCPLNRHGTFGNYQYTVRDGADLAPYAAEEHDAGETEPGARPTTALSVEPRFVYLKSYASANEAAGIALQAIIQVGKPAALWYSPNSRRLRVCAPNYAGPRSEVNIGVFGPDATIEMIIEEGLGEAMGSQVATKTTTTITERVTERSITAERQSTPLPAIPQFVSATEVQALAAAHSPALSAPQEILPPAPPAADPQPALPAPDHSAPAAKDPYEEKLKALTAERDLVDAEIAMVRLLQVFVGGRCERLMFMLEDYAGLLIMDDDETQRLKAEALVMKALLRTASHVAARSPFKRAAKLLRTFAEINEDSNVPDEAAACRELAELFSGAPA